MKRIVAFFVMMVMFLCVFTGCGGNGQPSPQPQTEGTVQTEAQTEIQEQTEAGRETETFLQDTTDLVSDTAAYTGNSEDEAPIDENGTYTSKEEVALYLHTYGRLPDNYLTKKEAQALGWDNKKGNLQDVAPGMSIGGDRFGNYEGLLPEADKRKYFECDIDYEGGYRGSERIIYSNDGLIFYTEDHYKTFEQLYGE